jgi:NADH-quinone oxidoreductase subunit N
MNLSSQLFQLLHDIGHLGVEISLIGGAILLLIVGLFRVPIWAIKVVVAAVLVVAFFQIAPSSEWLFADTLISSRLSWAMVRVSLLSVLILLVYRTSADQRSSYYFLMLTTLAGAIMMMHARHFLLMYLALEMVSYGAYLMTNFSFNRRGHEAGIKYLLFGGVCSAVMLFGISMIYGVQGHLYLENVSLDSAYARLGAFFVLVGVLFKVSAVPFHAWVPNVYQSATPDATAFFSIVPKIAGLVLLSNVLDAWNWGFFPVMLFGIASILVGTFGAIHQTHVRRLVGYGAIAHTGFLIPFVLWDFSNEQFVWYVAIYALMNVAIFYVINYFESEGLHTLDQFAGAGRRFLIAGVVITVVLVALVGLPPTVGFTAKWILFSGIWNVYQTGNDSWVLAYLLIAIFATAIALYYYLRPSYQLFLMDSSQEKGTIRNVHALILVAFALALVGLFGLPDLLRWLY